MEKWNLDLKEDVRIKIEDRVSRHPHLRELIEQRLQALLDFPPRRWFEIRFGGSRVFFVSEHGQRIRFSGEADARSRTIRIRAFHIEE